MFYKNFIPHEYQKEARAQIRLFIPFLIAQLASTAMSTVDTIMAGWAGTVDLSGVAIGCSFYWPAYMFVAGVAYGVAPTISHLYPQKQFRIMHQSLFNALIVVIILGIITAVILSLLHNVLYLINSDRQMVDIATSYLYFVSFSLPATAVFNALIAYVEGLSITRPALICGLIQIMLDIPLNYIFIFGKFGMPAMGGIGCGLSTCFINIICAFGMFFYVKHSNRLKEFATTEKTNIIDKTIIKQFLKLSIPLGFSKTVEIACFSLAAVILSPFGPTVVAAHSITLNVSSLIFMIPMCLSLTTTIRTSYAMGQKNWHRATVVCRTTIILNLTAFVVYFTTLLTLRENVAHLYTEDEKVISIAVFLLLLNCIYMLPDSLQTVIGGILQGFKDSRTILITTVFAYWIIGLPLGYMLAWGYIGTRFEAAGIWIAFIVSLSIVCLIYSSRLFYLFRYRKLPTLLAQTHNQQ